MAYTITEDNILNLLKVYGTLLEEQLLEMLEDISPTRLKRVLNKLWKKDLIKFSGPDNAYIMARNESGQIDMLYVDCIWVMLSHIQAREDIMSAFRGRDLIKLVYFSNKKQSNYNFVYIQDKEDYQKISYINNRYINVTDEDMLQYTKFIFISDDEDVLTNMPIEKFVFPSICIHIAFDGYNRFVRPRITQIKKDKE